MKLIYRTTGRHGFRFVGKLSMYKCNIVIMKYDFHVKRHSVRILYFIRTAVLFIIKKNFLVKRFCIK